jgi:hypothetical protein
VNDRVGRAPDTGKRSHKIAKMSKQENVVMYL